MVPGLKHLVFFLLCFPVCWGLQAEWIGKVNSDESDFDFDDHERPEDAVQHQAEQDLRKVYSPWSSSESILCKNLQCKRHQSCVVKDQGYAVCVTKKKLKSTDLKLKKLESNKDDKGSSEEIDMEKQMGKDDVADYEATEKMMMKGGPCISCPIVKPDFMCGTDNQTYSSVCRLEFHNCVHKTTIEVACKGFCPCKVTKTHKEHQKEQQQKDRWNRYMAKYQHTLNRQQKLQKLSKEDKEQFSANKYKGFNSREPVTKIKQATYQDGDHNRDDAADPLAERNKEGGCSPGDLRAMGDRLLDWFSVVMNDNRKSQSRRRTHRVSDVGHPECKREASWMFHHLDTDGDAQLSLRELYDLEHDDRERCLQPYLTDCDTDQDLFLSTYEWCTCFDKSQRPCSAALQHASKSQSPTGAYIPQCDTEGYYQPTQCHGSTGICWCVDKHGVEFTNTRRQGRPDCEGLLARGVHPEQDQTDDRESDTEDSEEDNEEGSADRPLDF